MWITWILVFCYLIKMSRVILTTGELQEHEEWTSAQSKNVWIQCNVIILIISDNKKNIEKLSRRLIIRHKKWNSITSKLLCKSRFHENYKFFHRIMRQKKIIKNQIEKEMIDDDIISVFFCFLYEILKLKLWVCLAERYLFRHCCLLMKRQWLRLWLLALYSHGLYLYCSCCS